MRAVLFSWESIKLKRSVYACAALNSCHTGLQKHQYYIEDILFSLSVLSYGIQCAGNADVSLADADLRQRAPLGARFHFRTRHLSAVVTDARVPHVYAPLSRISHTLHSPLSRVVVGLRLTVALCVSTTQVNLSAECCGYGNCYA